MENKITSNEIYLIKAILYRMCLLETFCFLSTEVQEHWIIKDNKGPVSILDAGTGSGCIAIALAKNIIEAEITATDLSDNALKIAGFNAEFHKLSINFIKGS